MFDLVVGVNGILILFTIRNAGDESSPAAVVFYSAVVQDANKMISGKAFHIVRYPIVKIEQVIKLRA